MGNSNGLINVPCNRLTNISLKGEDVRCKRYRRIRTHSIELS